MESNRIDDFIELALSKIPNHDISGALKILDEASEIVSDNTELLNLQGNCYYLLGDFYQAKQVWENVLKLDPNNKNALSWLEKLESPSFQFWLKRYYRAIEAIESKEFSEALVNLQKLIKENDGFVSLYQLLGLSYLALNDEKNAHKVWTRGLQLDINNEKIIKYLNTPKGLGKRRRKTLQESDNLDRNPRNNILMIVSGFFVMLLLLQMSFTINKDDTYKATIENLKAKVSMLNEELNEKDLLSTVMAIDNFSTDITADEELSMDGSEYDVEMEKEYYKAGYQAYLSNDFKTAYSNLGVVVSMSTKNYINREALYYLALTYYVNKDYDNAKKYFHKYLKEFPDTNYTDESLYYLGCIYYFQEDLTNAQMMLKELKDYDPQSGYLSTNLYREIMVLN